MASVKTHMTFCKQEDFYSILQKQQISISVTHSQPLNDMHPPQSNKINLENSKNQAFYQKYQESPLMEYTNNSQHKKQMLSTPVKKVSLHQSPNTCSNNKKISVQKSPHQNISQQQNTTPKLQSRNSSNCNNIKNSMIIEQPVLTQIYSNASQNLSTSCSSNNSFISQQNQLQQQHCTCCKKQQSDQTQVIEYYQKIYLKKLEEKKNENEFLQNKLNLQQKNYQDMAAQLEKKMLEKEQLYKKIDEDNKRLRKERNTLQLKVISLDQKFKKYQFHLEKQYQEKQQEFEKKFEQSFLQKHKEQIKQLQEIQQHYPQFQQYIQQMEQNKMQDETDELEMNDQQIDDSEMRSLLYAMRLQAAEKLIAQQEREQYEMQQNIGDIDTMTYEQILELQDKIGYVSKGLAKEQIKNIQKQEFNESLKKYGESCSICCGEFQEKEKVRILNCNHIFHSACIKQWLKQEKTCPVCKKEAFSAANKTEKKQVKQVDLKLSDVYINNPIGSQQQQQEEEQEEEKSNNEKELEIVCEERQQTSSSQYNDPQGRSSVNNNRSNFNNLRQSFRKSSTEQSRAMEQETELVQSTRLDQFIEFEDGNNARNY